MKRLLLSGVAVAALAGTLPAHAADLARPAPAYKAPVAPPVMLYNWTGFYIGGHVGGLWSSKDWTEVPPFAVPGFPATASTDPDGFLGGVQAGFNWQTGPWVWGVEVQWSWADADGCGRIFVAGGPTGDDACSKINWVGSVAGRLGYAWDRLLLYVKGGVAFADEEHVIRNAGVDVTTKPGDTRTGWMVGVGLEYGFLPNWSAKIEYNFMDFGGETHDFAFVPPPGGVSFDIDQQVHVVKFGINYRFGWGAPVVARY